jgi:hypothetical protein
MSVKSYRLELKAQIKKGDRMERLIEVSIPMSSIPEAVKYRQPFCDAICAALKKAHRRDKRSRASKSSEELKR